MLDDVHFYVSPCQYEKHVITLSVDHLIISSLPINQETPREWMQIYSVANDNKTSKWHWS